MSNELVDHVMQIADSYRDARLPESAEVFRRDLATVIGQIQQIVAMECLGAVALLQLRNGHDSREGVYRSKIDKLVKFHYGIPDEVFTAFMQDFKSWEMPPRDDEEIKC
jgi:hypothetical protein